MRPGLHADDIYIMVEDEFLCTAHLYTTHLHHAEYQRLKHLARSTNASTIQNISRPVDSITTMRAETKRKKAAEAQSIRTKAALEEMKGKSMVRAGGEGSDFESSFDENDGVEGPWEGTQLQRFMVKSPRKGLTSLTGLQGVMSHTRAAKGFERPEVRGASPTPRRANAQRKGGRVAVEEDSSSGDDDDLDAPKRAPSRAPAPVSKTPAISKRRAKPPSPPRPAAKRSFLDLTPLPKPAPTNTTKPSEKTHRDPNPPPAKHEPVAEETRSTLSTTELLARRRRMKAKREREEKERKMSGSRKMGVDEIPVFLV